MDTGSANPLHERALNKISNLEGTKTKENNLIPAAGNFWQQLSKKHLIT